MRHNDTNNSQLVQSGFTLTELIIVVSIAALITSFAIPSMKSAVSKSDITSISNEMVSSLKFARLEAVKRISSTTIQANGGDENAAWTKGFTITQEVDKGGNLESMNLRVSEGTRNNIRISSGTNSMAVSFDARGFADKNHSIELCDSNDNSIEGRRVTVEASGHVFSEAMDCAN